MKPKSIVLIIAGSDSSGGAGIQADIKTVTTLGSYAMTAITAVTAQNTTGVRSIVSIKPGEISNQIDFSAKDIRPNAVKIGMLHSKQVIQVVIKSLNKISQPSRSDSNNFSCSSRSNAKVAALISLLSKFKGEQSRKIGFELSITGNNKFI